MAPHLLSNVYTASLYVILPWKMWKFYEDKKGMILAFMGQVIQEAPPVAQRNTRSLERQSSCASTSGTTTYLLLRQKPHFKSASKSY